MSHILENLVGFFDSGNITIFIFACEYDVILQIIIMTKCIFKQVHKIISLQIRLLLLLSSYRVLTYLSVTRILISNVCFSAKILHELKVQTV